MAHKEYRKAGMDTLEARIHNCLLGFSFFFRYIIISEREEKRYGKRQFSVASMITNENISTSPLEKFKLTRAEASTLEIMRPVTGTPLLLIALNVDGNSLSLAAARGICPWIRIHPFKAPKHAIAAPIATSPEAQSPQTICAASANGAAEFCRSPGAMIPIIPVVLEI